MNGYIDTEDRFVDIRETDINGRWWDIERSIDWKTDRKVGHE